MNQQPGGGGKTCLKTNYSFSKLWTSKLSALRNINKWREDIPHLKYHYIHYINSQLETCRELKHDKYQQALKFCPVSLHKNPELRAFQYSSLQKKATRVLIELLDTKLQTYSLSTECAVWRRASEKAQTQIFSIKLWRSEIRHEEPRSTKNQ